MGAALTDSPSGDVRERPDRHVVSSLTRREMDASSLSVVDAGRQSLGKAQRIGPRTLDFYDFVFVTEGRGWFRSGTDEFSLRPGHLFVLFPHVPHAFASCEDDRLSITYVAFTGREASDVVESRFGWTPRQPVTDVSPALGSLLDLIDALIETMGEAQALDAVWRSRAYLWELLSRILPLCPGAQRRASSRFSAPVAKALNLFEKEYAREWSIPRLAALVHVSPSHLHALFKRQTGRTPLAYLTEVRINKAAALLATTDLSVREVALSVGFSDQAYFSRLFRKYKGVSPSRWRS